MIHILYGEGIQPSLSRSVRGSNKTEWKRNDYLIRFFTYIFQSNESPVIWFFKSEMSLTAGIRPVCSVVYQMTNIFGGVPNKSVPAEISSNSFGVLLNNNWPSLTNLEVFNGFATRYFPYYFWASNLFPEHDSEAFEYDEETCILLDHSLEMLLAMKWVLLVQHTLFLAIFNSIYLPHELVVGDAIRLIVLVLSVVKISVLQLFYSISKYLARLPDFILAGSELLIFVFWVNTPKMFWKNMVRDLKPIQKLILNMSMVHRLTNWLASFQTAACFFLGLRGLRTSLILRG
ncbi:hypothetical protein D8674_038674 [Pyrus ussuriensis x Pyrus communis]|uniref:Uncharacterized protein n=1 Tax=Pyrus ussuriensis x Pyrus communis TaxID=2448454 RepID=A0A5N5HVE1_9ROSA|nr:hypothetical protein D8674_038674 [Pyrus ussuriensis x Pyrus communis]